MKKFDPNVAKIKEHNAQVFRETTKIIQNGFYIAPSGKRVDLHMQSMIYGERCYHKELNPVDAPKVKGRTEVIVETGDCLKVAERLVKAGYNPALLNFASAGHPGGGVETGAQAQEESICRRTTLTRSLYSFDVHQANKYGYPLRDGNHYPLTQSLDYSMIYSPDVTVFREAGQDYTLMEHPFNIGVITNAALNFRSNHAIRLTPNGHMPKEAKDITRNKIRAILRVGLIKGHDSLVLGAFGCGSFNNPPTEMAQLFKEVMEEDEFKNRYRLITFAILFDHNDKGGNFLAFFDVLDQDADIVKEAEPYRGHLHEHPEVLKKLARKFFNRLSEEAKAEAEEVVAPATKAKRTQSPSKVLRVTLSDGTVIQEKMAKDTFIKALQLAGLERVQPLKLPNTRRPIISDTYSVRNGKKPHLVDGKYIFTHSATWQKRQQLEHISQEFGLGWIIQEV